MLSRNDIPSKKRLALVIIILILCCVTSITGTFAWFTDEVTATGNIISTGTLNVDLFHSNATDKNEAVSEETKLFDNLSSGLWEPGVVAYENFTVNNAGTLALKYTMNLAIDQETIVDGHRLSEAILYAVIPGGVEGESRDSVLTAANNANSWHSMEELTQYQTSGNLEPNQNDTFAIVLYWQPTNHDNNYNMNNSNSGKVLEMQISVHLNATQWTFEKDSFDTLYDENAEFSHTTNAVSDSQGFFTISDESRFISVTGETENANTPVSMTVTNSSPSQAILAIAEDGQTIASYDIHVEGYKPGSLVKISLQMETNLENMQVYHRETAMVPAASSPVTNTYTYDAATGVLTLYVDDFCPFHFIFWHPGHQHGHKPKPTSSPSPIQIPFTWSVNEDQESVTITGYTGTDPIMNVPTTINGYQVTHIGDNAFYVIEDGDENYTGETAFVTEVYLPDGLISIGYSAFGNQTVLKTIHLPDGLQTIYNGAFSNCSSLENITLPNSVSFLGHGTFLLCTSLKKIVIPENVLVLNPYLFSECYALEEVTLPDTLIVLDESAFEHCRSLKYIDIPDSVISIGGGVFYCCSSLESITIPDGITFLPQSLFYGCSSLQRISLPDSITDLSEYAFKGCTSLTEFVIPENVVHLESRVFAGCTSLQKVTLHSDIQYIDKNTFLDCPDSMVFIVEEGCIAYDWCVNNNKNIAP